MNRTPTTLARLVSKALARKITAGSTCGRHLHLVEGDLLLGEVRANSGTPYVSALTTWGAAGLEPARRPSALVSTRHGEPFCSDPWIRARLEESCRGSG